jgi:hypothetical protein
MRIVVRPSNAIKSALFATNHSHRYGAKQKVNVEADFEAVDGCNRLSLWIFRFNQVLNAKQGF